MVNVETLPSPKDYYSKNKIIEDISKRIHSGLNSNDITLYNTWVQKVTPIIKQFLLDDLNTLIQKRTRNTFTEFEGNLSQNPKTKAKIEDFFSEQIFSITALESYAFCPMQFFMQRILNLEEDEEIETTMTALERGSLIHDILFKFFMQLKLKKLNHQPWKYYDLLVEIANQQFETLNYTGLLWELEKEIYFGNAAQPGLWRKFLEVEENEINQSGFKPLLFETKFGGSQKSKSGYHSVPFVIKNKNRQIPLVGKIDRIDVDQNGNAIIFDYKTGSSGFSIKYQDILAGLSLQLPVYLAAAKEAFTKLKFNMDAMAGGYYLVKDYENCQRKTLFADIKKKPDIKISRSGGKLPDNDNNGNDFGIEQLINLTLDYISEYTENLFDGNFRHSRFPHKVECTSYCTFKTVCRKDIGKLISKQQQVENEN
jgi:ATP-dependent helicase/DNAse subunit B